MGLFAESVRSAYSCRNPDGISYEMPFSDFIRLAISCLLYCILWEVLPSFPVIFQRSSKITFTLEVLESNQYMFGESGP